jgi:hypothetical protein
MKRVLVTGARTSTTNVHLSEEHRKSISIGCRRHFRGVTDVEPYQDFLKKCSGCNKEFFTRIESQKYCSHVCYLRNGNGFVKWNREVRALAIRGENNPAKRLDVRKKLSDKLTGRKTPWLEGEMNPSKRPEVRQKISQGLLEHYKNDKWRENIYITQRKDGMGFSVESERHIKLKISAKKTLESDGFVVTLEKPIKLHGRWYIIDVFGEKENMKVIVECGYITKEKLADLRSVFDDVRHIPYPEEIL